MKRLLAFAVCLLLVLSLSACSSKFEFGGETKVIEKVPNAMSVKEIFKDIKNVDYYKEFDTTGLKEEKVEKIDSSTIDIYYKDAKGTVVYESGEGYGETFFKYHMKSVSGKDLICSYYDDGVVITSDAYTVRLSELNKDKPFGANSVEVNSREVSDSKLVWNIYYCFENNKWVPVAALYESNDGVVTFWQGENYEGGYDTDYFVRYARHTSEPKVNTKILSDPAINIMPEFIFGRQQFSYLNDIDNKWYITADFVLTFETEEERDAFADKYDIKESDPQGNESDAITLRTGKITVPVSNECKDLADLLIYYEVDDPYYMSVTTNENGEITEIARGGFYSLY